MGRGPSIEGRKNVADAQKAKVFTKLIREITLAVKQGGPDPARHIRSPIRAIGRPGVKLLGSPSGFGVEDDEVGYSSRPDRITVILDRTYAEG